MESHLHAEALWDDGEFVLSRPTWPDAVGARLVLMPAADRPPAPLLERLAHAYRLRADLDLAWAARPVDWDARAGRLTIEDPGGGLLAPLVGTPWEPGRFLRLAVGLAAALRGLHERGLIHKDLKPSNIFVDVETGRVWLSGFGLSSRVPRHRQTAAPPPMIAGTLAYMAPEQSGRMNRSIDSRSDLYACGVVLYELLTGGLPFVASDAMEWIHCHVARMPAPPDERVDTVPTALAAIVMKLLAKNAEDRYQTAAGLEADLKTCLAQWTSDGRIDPFPLGAHDVSDHLVVPERLYGRERDIDTLLAAFHRVVADGRAELVLVAGYAGIGKSSVVHELHRALVPSSGLFAAGKFDQLKRDVPYATLAQALRDLVRGLLPLRDTELADWRAALRQALGSHGQLLMNLIPDLELVIGPQPPVTELPAREAQNRFHMVFRRFVGVFARPEHPLVLFLDDLQWLDAPTLELLEQLMSDDAPRHLLLVGAYRDNEVDTTHPLLRTLATIRRSAGAVREIVLAPLTSRDIARLVADTLHCEVEQAVPVARLLHEKTGGNPFFVVQFLKTLAEDKLIAFDWKSGSWSWDLAGIGAKGYTDNVVELLVGKLALLPAETKGAVRDLACLGHRADTATLAAVHGDTEAALAGVLWEAIRMGLVLDLDDAYAFAHDRIQEAAYLLVPPDERPVVHLRIGRLLKSLPERSGEATFEIVNHLNIGERLITSRRERVEVAELNRRAGMRAKAATAYASALSYFAAGEHLLGKGQEDDHAALRFALALHRSECEIHTGDLDAAEPRLARLAQRVSTLVERSAVTCVRVVLFMARARPDLAVEACLDYLRRADIAWPPRVDEHAVRAECDRIWRLLDGRPIESLLSLPAMSDLDRQATMDVLCTMVPAAILTDENLLGMVIARMASSSIEHGNTDSSCYAYVLLNMVLGLRFDDLAAGYRFGKVSVDLIERRGLDRFKPRVFLCFGSTVLPWTQDLRTSRAWIRRAFDASLESGDFIHCAYSCNNLVTDMLANGDPLADADREAENGLAFARKARFGIGAAIIAGQLALIRALRGLRRDFRIDGDEPFDETRFERQLDADPHLGLPACWYWIRQLQARFYAGDYAAALTAAAKASRLLWTSPGFFETAEYAFFHGLASAAMAGSAESDRDRHRAALQEAYAQLARWAAVCPVNFADRVALLGAEIARLDARTIDAMRLYEEAIRLAHARGFIHHEGLAHERAARCCAAHGLDTMAQAHLLMARDCYERWGAHAKVRLLDQHDLHREQAPGPVHATGGIGAPVEQLDLATVVQVSQAVSGEIVLERLLDRLMTIALQHAGADRGLLLLPRGSELRVEADATSRPEGIAVRRVGRPPTPADLPESVLTYVLRTTEGVTINDATGPHPFADDEYLLRTRARSVLCLPLVKQARLIGVLYLENAMATHVFTPDRLAVLKLLASQAAVSVENARLYSDLQETEAYLAKAQRLSQTGSFGWRPSTEEVYWSAEQFRIFAVDPSITPTLELAFSRIHPDDRAAVEQVAERAARDGSDFDVEYRLLMANGAIKYVHSLAHGVRDDAGSLTFIGATLDVTAARVSQKALEKAFDEIRTLKDQLQEENVALREEIDKTSMFEEIVGVSAALRAVLSHVSKVAPTDSTVLITGETGTGKELVARAIHKRSSRASRPFVSVNCAAVPASLIASELFGHEKGAFTGATERRVGRFELAEGGTLFLDEVGELPAETQVALLRVLQEREFERVGGSRPIRANVRVIAATNRDLEAAILEKTFRADLFYRLNVFPLEVPALRDRPEDIPLLVTYFTDRFAKRSGKRIRGIGRKMLALLQAYDWPGNIRELQNVIERAVIISETDTLAVDARWLSSRSTPTAAVASPGLTLLAHERSAIEAALAATQGRVSGPFGAAVRLGIPASTLETKVKAMKIDKSRFKPSRAAHRR